MYLFYIYIYIYIYINSLHYRDTLTAPEGSGAPMRMVSYTGEPRL